MRFRQPRVRDEAHLDFVRSLPCVICDNNIQTEAAHIRSGELKYGKEPTGKSQKPHDCWTVPLCGEHHREQHTQNERCWWQSKGINQFTLAMSLYWISGDAWKAEDIIRLHRGTWRD